MTLNSDGQIDINVGDNYSVVDQVWNLKLMATSTLSTLSPGNEVDYEFTMNLVDGCTIDQLSSPSTITNFEYYIDRTQSQKIPTPKYTQLVPNCLVEWSLVVSEQGIETALTATQQKYINLSEDGSIDIDGEEDYSLAGEIWNLKLKATSKLSNVTPENTVAYEFTMSLQDGGRRGRSRSRGVGRRGRRSEEGSVASVEGGDG